MLCLCDGWHESVAGYVPCPHIDRTKENIFGLALAMVLFALAALVLGLPGVLQ